MIEINTPLRTAYYSLLNGNIIVNGSPIPVYYAQAPAGDTSKNYVLLSTIVSTGENYDSAQFVKANIHLLIVTKELSSNDGTICDSIASQIFSMINPSSQGQPVQIIGGHVINTVLRTDTLMPGLTDGYYRVLNRALIFEHLIEA